MASKDEKRKIWHKYINAIRANQRFDTLLDTFSTFIFDTSQA
jgi:uncharacterized protein YifE (UPF0438 family)